MPNCEENRALIQGQIKHLRRKLLDISRRNPLISTKFLNRSNSYIRVVDELPDVLWNKLNEKQKDMRFIPLPRLDDDPRDERSPRFLAELMNARFVDSDYFETTGSDSHGAEQTLEENQKIERKLKDRVRATLGMPPRSTSTDSISLKQHAQNNDISPSYDLPQPTEMHGDGRHTDDDIQTLLLPDNFARKLSGLISKYRISIQETGINSLHAAFGFLEWSAPDSGETLFSPLVLSAIGIKKKNTADGPEFWIRKTGDEAETNMALIEKLRTDLQIDIPEYKGGSIEEYLAKIDQYSPSLSRWRVRRWIAFGVFPSARMAMYYDLDHKNNLIDQSEIVKKLLGGSSTNGNPLFGHDYEIDQPEIENKVPYLVVDADSSQFSAMVDISTGKNVAIEGPPGTGKSQTIVNAIAAAIGDNKKVLFVAEKAAALEVVRSRLEAIGLGEFILPLQADRSAREMVIASIRDRVEMGIVPHCDREIQKKINEFRHARSELATYIETITAKFRESGFTIHDILGKSIATSDLLIDMPEAICYPKIHDAATCDKSQLGLLQNLGEAVENSWRKMIAKKPYWKRHKLHQPSKLMTRRACSTAKTAANAYHAAAKARTELKKLIPSLEYRATLSDLKLLKSELEILSPITSIDKELVRKIYQCDKLQLVVSFLDKCKNFQRKQKMLAQVLTDANNPEWPTVLQQIKQLCEKSNFDTLDTNAIRQRKASYVKIKQFADIAQIAPDFGIPKLPEARQLIRETSRDVLVLRTEIPTDPTSIEAIRQAVQRGKKLRKQQDEINNFLSITTSASVNDLPSHLAEIANSGPFSFLFRRYRVAKSIYLSISRRKSFEKERAIKDIQALIEWEESKKQFLADQRILTVLGVHFQGIDTDFCLLARFLSYCEGVEQKFMGLNNLGLKQFLMTGDLNILMSIPEIDGVIAEINFDNFKSLVKHIDSYLSNFDQVLGNLTSLTRNLNEPASIRLRSLGELTRRVEIHFQLKNSLDGDTSMSSLLGDQFQGASTVQKKFENDIGAVKVIMSSQFPHLILDVLMSGRIKEILVALEVAMQRDHDAEDAANKLSHYAVMDIGSSSDNQTHLEIAKYLDAVSKDQDGLDAHSAYAAALNNLKSEGFDWVVTELLKSKLPLDNLGSILEAIIMRILAIQVDNQYGKILNSFNGERLDELRKQLADTDRRILELSRDRIKANARNSASPPIGNGVGPRSTWTEMALIQNEVAKRQRFISIRDLTERALTALLELKPCWMMSPLAVAQYLPPSKIYFNLCIIDEASQMPPEDSIGALVRSRQAVVVGDVNQLPPTNFFRTFVNDEDVDEDEAILNESILEMANATFRPKRRLRWHYRSRHSELIKFSNHLIYDDDLIVFPSANESRQDRGVSLVPVPNGLYKSGINSVEADLMIRNTLEFMHINPDRSLGLVTVNQKQRDLLLEKMEFELSRNQAAFSFVDKWAKRNGGLDSFFIKNLENVQGDERDVIFIGTVYGPETLGGPVLQRFGPITHIAGPRRLNVLFTRAKEQIVTFSSMTASDIRADSNANPGVYILKRWLEYSATKILPTGDDTNREPDSDFERFVINQIESMGCEPVPQVGAKGYFIDIGIKHPEWPHGFLMGVECDGKAYHSSPSARDRDRLRQEVLEGLGWHLHRIWSTEWFNNPRKEAARLRQAICSRLEHCKQIDPNLLT